MSSDFNLNLFILGVQRYGLPTRFLEVLQTKYTFKTGGANRVWPFFNRMYLRRDVIDSVRAVSPLRPKGEAAAIGSIYHEATHAYLDINSDNDAISNVLADAVKYYENGPLRGGGKISDPQRVTQEAAGEYVGGKARVYWNTLEEIFFLDEKRPYDPPIEVVAEKIVSQYNADMRAVRISGYQKKGFFSEEERFTTLTIYPPLKDLCDHIILEGKIPDNFAINTYFSSMLNIRVANSP